MAFQPGGTNYWKISFIPYGFLILTPVFATVQLSFLNKGMEEGSAVVALPVYDAIFIIMIVAWAGVFFDEFHEMSPDRLALFFLGIAITIVGVGILAQHPDPKSNPVRKQDNPASKQEPRLAVKVVPPDSQPTGWNAAGGNPEHFGE
jgi:multidrug transporter EmrE-like cation transporter